MELTLKDCLTVLLFALYGLVWYQVFKGEKKNQAINLFKKEVKK